MTISDDALHAAFMRVADSRDWRRPICKTITVDSEQEIQMICHAIDVLAGGGCVVHTYRRRNGALGATFRAPGHYAMVNRSELSAEDRQRLMNGSFAPNIAHAVDIDVESKTITLRCVRCGTLSLEHLPNASDLEMRKLSIQWSSGARGRIATCTSCDRPPVTPAP